MKEQKQGRPGAMQQDLPGPSVPGEKSVVAKGGAGKMVGPYATKPRPELNMRSDVQSRTDAQARKRRGRLNRETLLKLGKVLEAYFDDVRGQGVPDRFKELLQRFDGRRDDTGREDACKDEHEGSS